MKVKVGYEGVGGRLLNGLLLAGPAAIFLGLGAPAAQTLPGPPGIDYYPSWMQQGGPWISGADQDYDPLPGDRFKRTDSDFEAWRAEQIRLYGTDYYKRPSYEEDYLNWREVRETQRNPPVSIPRGPVGAGSITRDRDITAEPTLGR